MEVILKPRASFQGAVPSTASAAEIAALAIKSAKELQAELKICESSQHKTQKELSEKLKLLGKINEKDNNCWQRLKESKVSPSNALALCTQRGNPKLSAQRNTVQILEHDRLKTFKKNWKVTAADNCA